MNVAAADAAMVSRTATPIDPPICWEVLGELARGENRLEAEPGESFGVHDT
jgi:hypothetical protein